MLLGKWILRLAALFATACFTLSLAACSPFSGSDRGKNALTETFEKAAEQAGAAVLTLDSDLQGKRQTGQDSFQGSYKAIYAGFSGTEFLFGGTVNGKETARSLSLHGTLEMRHGAAQLFWLAEEGPVLLAEENGEFETTLSVGESEIGYLILQGEALAGKIELTLENHE